jgi:hypothetical protein
MAGVVREGGTGGVVNARLHGHLWVWQEDSSHLLQLQRHQRRAQTTLCIAGSITHLRWLLSFGQIPSVTVKCSGQNCTAVARVGQHVQLTVPSGLRCKLLRSISRMVLSIKNDWPVCCFQRTTRGLRVHSPIVLAMAIASTNTTAFC